MSDTEQFLECIANCTVFICEILCFCCLDAPLCTCQGSCCCGSCSEGRQTDANSRGGRTIVRQPRRVPQQIYSPEPSAPSENEILVSPVKCNKEFDAPPSYEEATSGNVLKESKEINNSNNSENVVKM